ncbi:hypothetical protein GCM10009616_17200 [Microlunatus lacustris]
MRDGRTWVGAVALLCAIVLGGCTPDPGVTPSPSPTVSSASPVETDAERQERLDYAAAEKAYRTFRAEFGRVMKAGGAKSPTMTMKQTAGGDYLAEFSEIIQAYRGLGLKTVGDERIEYVRQAGYSATRVSLEVCEDSRLVQEVDSAGKSSPAGELRTALIEVRRVGGAWKLWSGEGKKVSTCE